MDYEKAYKDALERAREWAKNPTVWSSDDVCQKIFPELCESEDEKIRKELLCFFKDREEKMKNLSDGLNIQLEPLSDRIFNQKVIAWLEKYKPSETFDYTCANIPQKDWGELPEKVNEEDYSIDAIWHAVDILERTLGKVEGYQSDDGILEHQCAIDAVKKLKELQSLIK